MQAVWAVLNGTDAAIRPERAISGPVKGQATLQVEFASPSPLGNLSWIALTAQAGQRTETPQ